MTLMRDDLFRFGDYQLIRRRTNSDADGAQITSGLEWGSAGVGIVLSFSGSDLTSAWFHDHSSRAVVGDTAAELIMLVMPRNRAPVWLVDLAVGHTRMDDERPGVRLLAGHLTAVADAARYLGLPDGMAALEAAVVMARTASLVVVEPGTDRAGPVDAGRRAEAIRLINGNLVNPALTIDSLATDLGVSRATLFRTFAADNGVDAYIRGRRLELARKALLARSGGRPSIAEIAHIHGFSTESHFSRAFRKVYGHAPGALASKALLNGPPSALSEVPEVTSETIDRSSARAGDSR